MIQKTKAGACPNYCHIHWDLQLLDLQGFPSIAPPTDQPALCSGLLTYRCGFSAPFGSMRPTIAADRYPAPSTCTRAIQSKHVLAFDLPHPDGGDMRGLPCASASTTR